MLRRKNTTPMRTHGDVPFFFVLCVFAEQTEGKTAILRIAASGTYGKKRQLLAMWSPCRPWLAHLEYKRVVSPPGCRFPVPTTLREKAFAVGTGP